MAEAPRVLHLEWRHKGVSSLAVARFRLPDGSEIEREVEHHGGSVGVLPYDPERRVALLVRQPRVGPMLTGEETFLLECPSGRLDADDPEEEARREAAEEVGLRLRELEFVASCWSLASASTERIRLYLAPFASADRVGEGGGLAEENEAIQVIEMPLGELAERAAAGRLTDMKTLLLAFALQLRRPELFRAAQAT